MVTFQEIKDLCWNRAGLSEPELVSKLKQVTQIDPNVLATRDEHGRTLLYFAASTGRSREFCQVLHEQNGTLVKTTDNICGMLPIHHACRAIKVETAKYLFEVYPESINIPDNEGWYPIHLLAQYYTRLNDGKLQLLAFLLKHDKGAVSTFDKYGNLPLHLACIESEPAFVKLLFDAHPEAVHVMNNDGRTPLDMARAREFRGNRAVAGVDFFETQLRNELQARERLAPDMNGQLPIHQAILDEAVSAGTIKLMVAANPNSVLAVDNEGSTPLHLACQVGNVDKLKHLVERNEDILQIRNSQGEFPLQVACCHGRCNIINYILEKSDHGVSVNIAENKLPIQALLFDANCDRDSLEFVEAVGRLLFAHPVNPVDLAKEDNKRV